MKNKNYGEAYGSGKDMPMPAKNALFGSTPMQKEIETTDAEYFDMNRMQNRPPQQRGYNDMAFDYEY